VRSIALAYPRYELRVFTTPGRHTGNLGLAWVFYIPVPIASGGSLGPYEVRTEFTCNDPAGCGVDPTRTRFVGDADSGVLTSRCSGAPLQGEPRADPDGKWRLAPRAGLALSCDVTASNPAEIVMHLGEAIVIGDGTARAPSVVLRRVVAYDGYW
jgi:hypothetical protein